VFYAARQRLQALAQREAAGESLWTPRFDERVRWRFIHALRLFQNRAEGLGIDLIRPARDYVLLEEGLPDLAGDPHPNADFYVCIETGPEELVLSLLEALVSVSHANTLGYEPIDSRGLALHDYLDDFLATVRTILREHRLSYDIVDRRFIPMSSLELHQEVVLPSLSLLGGRKDFRSAEAAFRDSLDQIATGHPDNAITDAATALQEALKAIGCKGNSLGPLCDDAKTKGLLGSHDSPMTDAIAKVVGWVSADRSTVGDAHAVSRALPEDAWLTVHIVGALILRLAQRTPRQQ
jgi:hypothetical protein